MELPKILLLLSLIFPILTQEIVDYSYTASVQKTHIDSKKKYDINIIADKLNLSSF